MELFLIYVWLKLDTILGVLGFASAVSLVVAIILMCATEGKALNSPKSIQERKLYGQDDLIMASVWFRRLITTGLLCLSGFILIPDKEDVAILAGSYFTLEAAKSPEAQKVWTLMRGKANELLDEQLKKLQPTK